MRLLNAYRQLYRSSAPEVRRFLWLSAVVEYQYLGIYLIALNLYLLRIGFGPPFIGVVTGSGIAAYSVMALLAGYVGRRRSAARQVVCGVLIIVFGLVGIAYTDLVPGSARAGWVLAANALAWMGGGLFGVGRIPYLAAVAASDQRVLTLSLERLMGIGLAFLGGLAVTFVPGLAAHLLGTNLDDPVPYRIAILLAPAALVPALAAFARATRHAPPLVEHHDEHHGSGARALPVSPRMMILMLSAFAALFNLAGTPPLYFFNVYLDEGLAVSPALIAFVMGIARLCSLPVTFFLPSLTGRWSLVGLLVAIAVSLAIALIPMAAIPHPLVASGAFLTCALLFAVYEPVFDLYRMEAVPAAMQTRMAGATLTATYGAQSAAGFVGGYAVVALGYPMLFLSAAALACAAALLLRPARRTRHPTPALDKLSSTPSRSGA